MHLTCLSHLYELTQMKRREAVSAEMLQHYIAHQGEVVAAGVAAVLQVTPNPFTPADSTQAPRRPAEPASAGT